MGNKRVVGEGSQIRNVGKSKWFARLMLLATGLVLSVGGVLGIGHISQSNDSSKDYALANSVTFTSVTVNANGLVSWNVAAPTDAFGDNRPFRIRTVEVRVNGSTVGTPYNNTNRPANASRTNAGSFQLNVGSLPMGASTVVLRVTMERRQNRCSCDSNCPAEWTGTAVTNNSGNLTFNRTGTLAKPTNVHLSGSTLIWSAVANANGYRIYRDGAHVANAGNTTSFNLAGLSSGSQHTFSVSATSTVAHWHNSGRGGAAVWGQMATPVASVSGNTLSWNAVSGATGYQIRLGGTVIHTTGAVTSLNLSTIPVGTLAIGYNSLNVVAISTAASWATSAASGNVNWNRLIGLHTPFNVSMNVYTVSWEAEAVTLPFVDSFHIRVGDIILATVGRDTRSFDLSTVPEGRNGARNLGVAGSMGALQAGLHSINIVAANNNSAAWPNSAGSSAVEFYRAGRVDSIAISAPSSNLIIEWPRPVSVGDMPSAQLTAAVSGLYGTNSAVTWSSTNPSIASVDTLSGFVRATWSDNMWEHRIANNNRFTVIRATSVFDGSVVGEFRVYVVFNDPPGPVTIGMNISGGIRDIELAPCGTKLASNLGGGSLANATQFSAVAYGYNLTSAMTSDISWASSDESIATIDAQGRLTVRGVGVVRITATSSVGSVPYAFYVTIVRDGTAIATGVTIFCDSDNSVERRLGIIPGDTYGFVDLRAMIEGHNIVSQLVTWASSCGATLGNPSEFLSMALTADGVRVTGRAQGGPFIITATPVGAIGAVGTFRIFVDQLVEPEVTSVSIAMPSTSQLVIPLARPILTTDLPSVQLTASLTGVGGAAASNVVWTSSCGARAGFGLETIAGEFVSFVLNAINPNIVTVIAVDRGQGEFAEQITITATSVITPNVSASRTLSVEQAAVSSINVTTAIGGQTEALLMIPYGYTDVNARGSLDLRAVVSVSHAQVSQEIVWVAHPAGIVILDNKHTIAQAGAHIGAVINVVTLRPLAAGVVTITAKGALCGTPSNEFTLEIVEECRTSVRVMGPIAGAFGYEMNIAFPRPDDIRLPVLQLGASVGGSFTRAMGLEWASSCGGDVIEFLGGNIGNLIMIRALSAGVVTITATHTDTGYFGTFIISVDEARLESAEILGDGVVREQTAMLIPLVYTDGVYTLSDVTARQSLELSLIVNTHGDVTTDFVWTSSDNSIVRIFGTGNGGEYGYGENVQGGNVFSKITNMNGFVTVLPYGVGTAIITATAVGDPTFYATFIIFVTRGTASCSIQDGILDLPTIQEGYVRIILVCEHYFGQARMSHMDMTYAEAMYHILPMLQIETQGAIFHGWSLSRGGSLLEPTFVTGSGSENYDGESGNVGEYVILIPMHFFDLEAGLDTILLFAVWYIPYVPSESNGSNLARNIIIGTLSVAGVGAAGTAGYVAQSRIRARRKSDIDEWGMD